MRYDEEQADLYYPDSISLVCDVFATKLPNAHTFTWFLRLTDEVIDLHTYRKLNSVWEIDDEKAVLQLVYMELQFSKHHRMLPLRYKD